jgi:hemerythrin superfamily protein
MAPAGSVIAVLSVQHDRIRELLAEVRDGGRSERRRQAFDALRALLAAHETAEEVVVRPVSAQLMDRDLIADRNREERRIVRLLADLEKLDARGADFAEAFGPFEQALVTHLTMEEAEEFPVLEAEVGERERRAMARWMERAVALGPSHAHPFAAGSPAAQRAVGPFTALLDHARDRLERTRARGL